MDTYSALRTRIIKLLDTASYRQLKAILTILTHLQ